ncbi:hypothetical protein LSCM4_01503 [Leishmania orientalis]|uniref:Class I transcription factor A, subunit 2 n=1 Tax=Leishmania orientalis TaxID=2249476 RepID=A0A836K7S8_9TRYP|nr:hypothetical protein LSCM4_01503 [Leishmania orientalis]
MPTKNTQVYWHDLPTPRPPWRNAEELKQCVLESRRVAAQIEQQRWRNVRGDASSLRTSIPRVLQSRARLAGRADRMRHRATRHIEYPVVFRRIVPEPHATPLQVVNLIMEHLRQRPVLSAEAAEVVERVTLHFNTLTQSQRPVVGRSAGGGSRLPCSDGCAGSRDLGVVTASVLSQVQQQNDARVGLTPSQATIGASGGTVGSLSMALQDSLLLDTVAEFCAARGLAFRRLSRADLRGMHHRISSVEAVPHRRVVLLADRHDPIFAVLFGVSRQVTPEPFVVSALQLDGKTPKSMQRYRKAEAPVTQVFCMAPAPVPWRRITRNISVSTLRDEFVVAVVELDGSEEAAGAEEFDDGFWSDGSRKKRRCAPAPSANAPPRRAKRQRTVDLLGVDEEEMEDERDFLSAAGTDGHGEATIILNPEDTSSLKASSDAEQVPLERRWLESAPLFPGAAQRAEASARGVATELTDMANDEDDPLLTLPRSEGTARRRGSHHRVWYRRLLPKGSGDFMARMHTCQVDE